MNMINKKIIAVLLGVVILVIFLVMVFSSSNKVPDTSVYEGGKETGNENSVLITDLTGPFTITYLGTENSIDKISITNSSPNGRQKAVKWLKDQGYNPSNLDISFVDFINPLFDDGGVGE